VVAEQISTLHNFASKKQKLLEVVNLLLAAFWHRFAVRWAKNITKQSLS
jgi:hypothetical protein